MVSGEAKVTTTIRLKESTKFILDISASLLDRSHSSITEEALSDFFEKHNLNVRYQIHVLNDLAILTEIRKDSIRVLETQFLGRKSEVDVQREYAQKLRTAVTIVKETP